MSRLTEADYKRIFCGQVLTVQGSGPTIYLMPGDLGMIQEELDALRKEADRNCLLEKQIIALSGTIVAVRLERDAAIKDAGNAREGKHRQIEAKHAAIEKFEAEICEQREQLAALREQVKTARMYLERLGATAALAQMDKEKP